MHPRNNLLIRDQFGIAADLKNQLKIILFIRCHFTSLLLICSHCTTLCHDLHKKTRQFLDVFNDDRRKRFI